MIAQKLSPGRFVEWLEGYTRENGMTASDLAVEAGLSASTLLRIRNEPGRKPSYKTIVKLARTTGVSENFLLELAELPALAGEAALNPLRPKLLKVFDAMSPSMQASFISVGESMLSQTRKARP